MLASSQRGALAAPSGDSLHELPAMRPSAPAGVPAGVSNTIALHGDVLTLVLEHVDGFTLGRLMTVAKEWHEAGCSDYLWRNLVLGRWHIAGRKKNGKYKFGERSWRECWRVFHRRNRLPTIEGISDREVVYATGQEHRIAFWFLVSHQPACKLIMHGEPPRPYLAASLRSSRFVASPTFDLVLTLRDGTRVCARTALKPKSTHKVVDIVVEPLQYTVTEIVCEMPPNMRYEPDALEACQLVQLSAYCHGGKIAVNGRFASEETIWQHYEQITHGFYVHNVPEH